MKRKYKNITQSDIAKMLGVGQPIISRIFKGEIAVTWPIAEKMAKMFQYRDLAGWKNSTPQQFKAAFDEKKYGDLISILQSLQGMEKS